MDVLIVNVFFIGNLPFFFLYMDARVTPHTHDHEFMMDVDESENDNNNR